MNRLYTTLALFFLISVSGVLYLFSGQQTFPSSAKPQTPTAPYDYIVEDFKIHSVDQETIIGGTLTLPQGQGPFPAAILLSVAGPNDRDQAFAGHRGFHVLADHLTKNGFAVARYDDRGIGVSGGSYFDASWEDYASDANAVAQFLGKDLRINPDKIGFIGMSQGGPIGALASVKYEPAAFVVLLSAPGLNGPEALSLQLENTLAISGIQGDQANQYRALFTEFMSIVQRDPSSTQTRVQLIKFLNGPGRALIPAYQFMPKDTEGLADVLLGPWYQSNLNFDPVKTYSPISSRVLALGGSLDLIAPPSQHLVAISDLYKQTQHQNITTIEIDGLNHLLQEAVTGLPTEYAKLENSFSDSALDAITQWLKE